MVATLRARAAAEVRSLVNTLDASANIGRALPLPSTLRALPRPSCCRLQFPFADGRAVVQRNLDGQVHDHVGRPRCPRPCNRER